MLTVSRPVGSQLQLFQPSTLPGMPSTRPWTVVDLFSGAGGASAGFRAYPGFAIVGAADAQLGKPSSAPGSLGCNATYARNLRVFPVEADLARIHPADLADRLGLSSAPTVLIACPPCTGFSRTNSRNHLVDDPRNNLVPRVARFVEELKPDVLVMENARELLQGNFVHHFSSLEADLRGLGYSISAEVHRLDRFGLPQIRERALIVASRRGLAPKNLSDLWKDRTIRPEAATVRAAIGGMSKIRAGETDAIDQMHTSPSFASELTSARIEAIPRDGGSWRDLLERDGTRHLLTRSMLKLSAAGKLGSFPDVYGRMAWDRPAPTIKRESAHVGNGRYAHPEQARLCSVREMAILQGFPRDFIFTGNISNRYRHIGDAVPPLIAYQIAAAVSWTLTGARPSISDLIMPNTHLSIEDITMTAAPRDEFVAAS